MGLIINVTFLVVVVASASDVWVSGLTTIGIWRDMALIPARSQLL